MKRNTACLIVTGLCLRLFVTVGAQDMIVRRADQSQTGYQCTAIDSLKVSDAEFAVYREGGGETTIASDELASVSFADTEGAEIDKVHFLVTENRARSYSLDEIERMELEEPSASVRPGAIARAGVGAAVRSHPNPFHKQITINLNIQRAGPLEITLYNDRGRMVRSLYKGFMPELSRTFTWDGTDEANRMVGSGAYFVVVKTGGGYAKPHRIVLAR
ncbi:MAG: T9SS type A sorting domain-containing protein [Chitinivibrionales bacterium]|nr:T9SS type A sorting domain-containing protein [Chitinivibrionales bacterium]MBD3355834.1 T9SS type A sorting domain-containing protein [Chitinivibrionales bacterium]